MATTVLWAAVIAAVSARLFVMQREGTLSSTPLYSSCFLRLRMPRGQHVLHGARVMLSGRIADALSARIVGSWCGTVEENYELSLGWERGRDVVGGGLVKAWCARLLPNRGEKCRTMYVCIFCAPLLSCLSSQLSFDTLCDCHLLTNMGLMTNTQLGRSAVGKGVTEFHCTMGYWDTDDFKDTLAKPEAFSRSDRMGSPSWWWLLLLL